jgi:hypothetical protein
MTTDIKQTTLYDEFGDEAAQDFTLEDIAAFAALRLDRADIEVIYEDYDDYGVEHYVLIPGICADLVLKKDYGGMYSPTRGLVCSIQTKAGVDVSTRFEYPHPCVVGGVAHTENSYWFHLKNKAEQEAYYGDYEEHIGNWLDCNAKYLEPDETLFYRVDHINYPDLRGSHKWGNGITSYDPFRIADSHFYTSDTINNDADRELIQPEY